MTDPERVEPVELARFLDQAAQCREWRALCDQIKPFVEAMVDCKLLLAERDALLHRAAEIFGCSESSLLIDMRRARVEQAAAAVQAELNTLEQMWRGSYE